MAVCWHPFCLYDYASAMYPTLLWMLGTDMLLMALVDFMSILAV